MAVNYTTSSIRNTRRWIYSTGRKVVPYQTPFTFRGKEYPYYFHHYNVTWKNERAVEIALAKAKLKQYRDKRVLELGNVLNHYLKHDHDVVDKYEKWPGVVNKDIQDFKPKRPYDLIVSISTVEHIGWDEEKRDPKKIPQTLKKLESMLAPGGELFVTFPLGWNHDLDLMLQSKQVRFGRQFYMKRTEPFLGWKQVPFREVKDIKYGRPFINANGLVIGVTNAPKK